MEPFDTEVIKDIHRKVISKGPIEEESLRDCVRDEGTLSYTAISAEKISDPVAMAAFLLHRIATQHPFFEGNKRTAWAAAMCILDVYGHDVEENSILNNAFVRSVASGNVKEKDVAKWLKERMRSLTE